MERTKKTLKKKYTEIPPVPPKKNKFWTWVFVAFNVLAVAIIVLMERTQGTEVDILSAVERIGMNVGWFLVVLFMYFLALYAESRGYSNLIYATSNQYRFGLGVRVAILGKYYDNLTPLATGGQPFQIYTLAKRNIPAGTGTSVVMIKYFMRQLVFDVTVLCFLIFSPFRPSPLITYMAYVGLLILIALPLLLAYAGFNKKSGGRILSAIMRLLSKIRIVKDYDSAFASLMVQVDEFRASMIFLFKRKLTLAFQLAMAAIEIFVQISVPYFVYRSFGMSAESYFSITTLYVYCLLAVSFVPTPGTSGAAEASFYTVFSTLITNGMVFWALLLWRFASFYVYIIAGIVLQVRDFIIKLIYPRAKKSECEISDCDNVAEADSENFEFVEESESSDSLNDDENIDETAD